MIGIDNNTWLVYEGVATFGHGVSPTPLISVATLILGEDDWNSIPSSPQLDNAKLIFREDFFDPSSRIRRGRLYEWRDGGLQQEWRTAIHPLEPDPGRERAPAGMAVKSLLTYRPFTASRLFSERGVTQHVVIGTQMAATVWRIVSSETIASGEVLFTLHARSSFGALPDLIQDQVPLEVYEDLLGVLEPVANAAFRSSPTALIELCRAATTVILSRWLAHLGHSADRVYSLDLGGLVQVIESHFKRDVDHAGIKATTRLVRLFHSRCKPSERDKYQLRPPTERDAQLVLLSLGFLLIEIGWAR